MKPKIFMNERRQLCSWAMECLKRIIMTTQSALICWYLCKSFVPASCCVQVTITWPLFLSELPTKFFGVSSASSAVQLSQKVPWCWLIIGLYHSAAWVSCGFCTFVSGHLTQHIYVPSGMKNCFLPCVYRRNRQGYVSDFQDNVLFKDLHMMNERRFLSLDIHPSNKNNKQFSATEIFITRQDLPR